MVILRWFKNLRPRLKKNSPADKTGTKNDKPETLRPIGKKNSRDRAKILRHSVFPSIVLYPLFYCGVSREVTILMCSITTIISLWENREQ